MKSLVIQLTCFALAFAPSFSLAAKPEIDKKRMHRLGAEIFLKSIQKLKREGPPARGTKNYESLTGTFPFMKKFLEKTELPEVQKTLQKLNFVRRGDSAVTVKYNSKILDFTEIDYYHGTFKLNGKRINLLKTQGKTDLTEKDVFDKESRLNIFIPAAHAFFGNLGSFSLDWFFGTGMVLLGAGLIFGAPMTFPVIAGGLLISAVAGFAGPALTGVGKGDEKNNQRGNQ